MTGLTVLNIARKAYDMVFWYTPYRTGNLARNGISDFKIMSGGYGWTMFGKGAEYGAILNESATISYKITNPVNGSIQTGKYQNRHYKWLDKFADLYASEIPLFYPNVRRIL